MNALISKALHQVSYPSVRYCVTKDVYFVYSNFSSVERKEIENLF